MKKISFSNTAIKFCGVLAVFWSCGQVAQADYLYGEPTRIPHVGLPGGLSEPQISPDGLELYFASASMEECQDLYVMRRSTIKEPWGAPVRLDPPVNSAGPESSPCISADGLELYFGVGGNPLRPTPGCEPNPNGYGGGDLWVSRRATREDPWGNPANLGPTVNRADYENDPSLSADGLSLYFTSSINIGDLFVTTRQTKSDPWGPAVGVGVSINTNWDGEWTPFISPDGLVLFFNSHIFGGNIHVSRRPTANDPWGYPDHFANVFSDGAEARLSFSAEDLTLYFDRGGALWQVEVRPDFDLNRDGKVDRADIAVLLKDSGQAYTRCDIAPSAWGNAMVDWQDLVVLMEYIEGGGSALPPGPRISPNLSPHAFASDVPCNVILNWTSPDCAETHDVYFGTSWVDVSTANRYNPRGVLVSKGQTATTYDREGLLEYGRTYYWRVDEVITSLDSSICKGRLMQFTVETFAKPVTSITATASSASGDNSGPMKTVDGSGLVAGDAHGTTQSTMWISKRGESPAWIQYEFDKVYPLQEMWVWNSNQGSETTVVSVGAKDVTVEVSTDGTTWTPLSGVPQFARATGKAGYAHNTTVDFEGIEAKYVKLTITSNWGGKYLQYGLSEVRFLYVPVRDYVSELVTSYP